MCLSLLLLRRRLYTILSGSFAGEATCSSPEMLWNAGNTAEFSPEQDKGAKTTKTIASVNDGGSLLQNINF